MKKIIFSLVVLFGLTLIFTPVNKADVVGFAVTATIPAATGVNITATEVDSVSNVFGATVTAFNFNPMIFNSALGIFLPDHFYAVDVGVVGGAGTTDINVKYTEGTRPVGQPATGALGFKSIVTFVRILGGPTPADQTQENLDAHGPTMLLKDLPIGGEPVTGSELGGGFFRALIGIYPGGIPAIEAAGGSPFTNADVSGNYTGTITITATVA